MVSVNISMTKNAGKCFLTAQKIKRIKMDAINRLLLIPKLQGKA
jgi:hypothetical protein